MSRQFPILNLPVDLRMVKALLLQLPDLTFKGLRLGVSIGIEAKFFGFPPHTFFDVFLNGFGLSGKDGESHRCSSSDFMITRR